MDKLDTAGTVNPGSSNDKQRDYFTSLTITFKTVLIRLAAWLSVAAVIL
jgi:hypothetical protein